MKFVDPTADIAFKKIFGSEAHKAILIEFLNETLRLEYNITEIQLLNPYQAPNLEDLKETTLDIKAKDQNDNEFIVEMQVDKDKGFYKRAIYYSSKAYSQQLEKTEKYHLLKPVIFLGILDFKIFDHEHYLSRHLILNTDNQQHNLKDLEFNFIELPKFNKQEHELTSISDKWIYFIKNASSLEHIPDNVESEALKQAYHIAQQHQWTRNELDVYEYQGLQIGKIKGAIDTAHEEGKQEGKLEEKQETALKAYQAGMSLELIAQITDLSVADCQKVLGLEI
jgi:predicted transposase/invertase (TIGR01784 family)